MNNSITPTSVPPQTSQASATPIKIAYSWAQGQSASDASVNKVSIPNALTREVMAETEAGINVVNCSSLENLFSQLDS